jgi:predicted nucleotidyltransferase
MFKKEITIMRFFVEEPNRQFHVRELAKLTRISPATVSKYLIYLEKEDYLIKNRERNHLLFSAKTLSDAYKNYKLFTNLERIRKSGLIEFLVDTLNQPNAIILFGSFAKSENSKESDVDLFILSESKTKLNLEFYEKKMGAEIQIFQHNSAEYKELKKKSPDLINNICNGIKLHGFLEII